MEQYVAQGALDSAIETGLSIIKLHAEDGDIISLAKVKLSELYMVKNRRGAAIDLLNQCIASYVPTQGLWLAWMGLASIYEYDANYADAYTTYRKVYEDCPKSLVIPWLARIKMGELADRVTSAELPKGIFEDVVRSSHPFVVPRTIAQYYRGVLTNDDLRASWNNMYPEDSGYIFFFVKKAVSDRQWENAREYLDELEEALPQTSWELMQAAAFQGIVHKHL
jgi:tetratricopeptide (TPR) repeat protein